MKDPTDTERDSSMPDHSSVVIGEALATGRDGQIVEESGPVDYCQDEGEAAMEDADLEQLAYDGDPLLLLSDFEEEEEGKLTLAAIPE